MPQCGKCHRDVAATALYCASCGAPIVPEQQGEVDPFIGKTFRGVYFVQQKVGGGGMGQVYKALHVTLDLPVALKLLNRELLGDPTIVQRFHREARAASRLRHPNVISVTDFGQSDDGVLFMVMEFVDGKSLARVIHEEFPLSEQRVVRIGAQILAALAEAHASGILHRDLKPENVMLAPRRDQPDAVKVVDFGIAKIQLPGEGQRTLTSKGLVCGTPGYMSPEQWSDEELDGRSDLYSAGVILYELLTGALPFEARTPMELVRKHLTERAAPPSARRADHTVSADLEGLVMRAIATSRDERPPSAEEMRADLLACVLLPEPAESSPSRSTPRRTVVLPRATPRRSPEGPGAGGALDAGGTPPGLPSPRAGRTPATERVPTPHLGPRPTPAAPAPGQRTRTPPPERGTPAPRHEEDEVDLGGEEPSPAPAPTPRRAPLIIAVTAGLLAMAVAVVVGPRLFSRKPPVPVVNGTAPGTAPSGPGAPPQPTPLPGPESTLPSRTEPTLPPGADPTPSTQSEPPAQVEAPPRRPSRPRPPEPRKEPALPRAGKPPGETQPEPASRRAGLFYVRDVINAIQTPAAATGDGVLAVLADPYGDVSIDGRPYGEAPREFRLPAGTYLVRVTHPLSGHREARLTVRAGERARWTASFSTPSTPSLPRAGPAQP